MDNLFLICTYLLVTWDSCPHKFIPSLLLELKTFEARSDALLSSWLNNSSMVCISNTRSLWVRLDVHTFSLPNTWWLGSVSQFSFFIERLWISQEPKNAGGGGAGGRGGGGGGGGGASVPLATGDGWTYNASWPSGTDGREGSLDEQLGEVDFKLSIPSICFSPQIQRRMRLLTNQNWEYTK